jgi:ubiquinone/menaquinone biosynthesis C-methylase UbiE
MESILDLPFVSISHIRSAGYRAEGLLLTGLMKLLALETDHFNDLDPTVIKMMEKELWALLEKDSANIRRGLYPARVLMPESPFVHLKRLPRLMLDGYRISRKRKDGRTAEFTEAARELAAELPRYYRRNFHFQTDGYLSDVSAELYDHQVELLFAGGGHAQRRLILPALREAFGKGDGKGLKFLEVGAGTGAATQFVKMAFPKARIVATDLSDPYLKFAQKRLAGFRGVDFLRANGAELPFQSEKFDAVFSIFLFHEMPLEEREAVIAESMRVVRPGGFIGLVDSIQKGDKPAIDQALAQFPKDYHEPFYRNYVEHPMERILEQAGVEKISSDTGFFSKVCWGTRPC